MSDDHAKRWMKLALHYARRAQGRTSENPAVGCVIVDKGGRLISAGYTAYGGRPHAEVMAITKAQSAGMASRLDGATAYVTLEPCAHYGNTPPCTQALIESGIHKLVYAIGDPDPRVSGKGHAQLEAGGLAVSSGLCEQEAEDVMAGFLSRMRFHRPYVSLKTATSWDGFISASSDAPTKITNMSAQAFVHDLRSRADALITGAGTILADDPELTVRIGKNRSDTPHRFILDSHLSCCPEHKIFKTISDAPVTLFCVPTASQDKQQALSGVGANIICIEPDGQRLSLTSVYKYLFEQNYNSVMIEAGARLGHAVMSAGMVDRLVWLKAPLMLRSGLPLFSENTEQTSDVDMSFLEAYKQTDKFMLGDNHVQIYHSSSMNRYPHHP